jgi:hypothetical protein
MPPIKIKMIVRTATEGLKVLWSEEYFETWRKASDIAKIFADRKHHFTDAELGMALNRANYLTRRGKRHSYEYIQKHPFIKEEQNEKSK